MRSEAPNGGTWCGWHVKIEDFYMSDKPHLVTTLRQLPFTNILAIISFVFQNPRLKPQKIQRQDNDCSMRKQISTLEYDYDFHL